VAETQLERDAMFFFMKHFHVFEQVTCESGDENCAVEGMRNWSFDLQCESKKV